MERRLFYEDYKVINMKIGFCTMEQFDNREKDSVGSSRIRGRWVWEAWKNIYPDDEAEQFLIGKQYDALVFQKVYWEQMKKAFNGIKILDLCDPDWLEGKNVMEYVNLCDACITSTPALAEYVKKFAPNIPVICVPDRVKLEEHEPRGKHVGNARKIVWFGYSHNQHYIYPTLEILAEKGMELTVISNQAYTPPMGFEFIKITNVAYSYPAVHRHIAECDLYLSPDRSDEKGKFKSNNKLLTAMALGVPVVETPDDLERLMTAEARNAQAEKDMAEIKEKWDIKYSVLQIKELIDEMGNTRR